MRTSAILHQTASLSPFNLLVGRWIGEARRARGLKTGDVAQTFGKEIQPAYVRSLEAGSNALPATAAPSLVAAFDIDFERASMLVAAVRMLDQRLPRGEAADRPYNLTRIEEKASDLKRLWPALSPCLDWLAGEIEQIRNQTAKRSVTDELRKSCEEQASVLDHIIRAPRHVASVAQPHDNRLSPLFEDMTREMIRKLSQVAPQMTREQQYQWEQENAHRVTGLWGVVSESDGVLRAADTIDWGMLLNSHRPVLHIAIPGTAADAEEIELAFRERLEKRISRPGAKTRRPVSVSIRSYESVRDRIEELRWIDQTTRTTPSATLIPTDGSSGDGKLVRMENVWLYELARPAGERSLIGLMDSYSEGAPTFFSIALSAADIVRWRAVLDEVHG